MNRVLLICLFSFSVSSSFASDKTPHNLRVKSEAPTKSASTKPAQSVQFPTETKTVEAPVHKPRERISVSDRLQH